MRGEQQAAVTVRYCARSQLTMSVTLSQDSLNSVPMVAAIKSRTVNCSPYLQTEQQAAVLRTLTIDHVTRRLEQRLYDSCHADHRRPLHHRFGDPKLE